MDNQEKLEKVCTQDEKFISEYLPYFEKNKYIFQYHSKRSLN
jgi:hypothetical protein